MRWGPAHRLLRRHESTALGSFTSPPLWANEQHRPRQRQPHGFRHRRPGSRPRQHTRPTPPGNVVINIVTPSSTSWLTLPGVAGVLAGDDRGVYGDSRLRLNVTRWRPSPIPRRPAWHRRRCGACVVNLRAHAFLSNLPDLRIQGSAWVATSGRRRCVLMLAADRAVALERIVRDPSSVSHRSVATFIP